jgi:hypothetical protein
VILHTVEKSKEPAIQKNKIKGKDPVWMQFEQSDKIPFDVGSYVKPEES